MNEEELKNLLSELDTILPITVIPTIWEEFEEFEEQMIKNEKRPIPIYELTVNEDKVNFRNRPKGRNPKNMIWSKGRWIPKPKNKFNRPRGRNPIGKRWDGEKGKWVIDVKTKLLKKNRK